MVEIRPMGVDDIGLIHLWDDDEGVAAGLGGRAGDWHDWPAELVRNVPWREFLIAQQDGRPVGFVQLMDAAEEESHYWGEVEPGTWAIDAWIGSPHDRGRGVGSQMMRQAVERCFHHHRATSILIDPLTTNRRAIAFYERLGFQAVGEHELDGDLCFVMRLDRPGA